MKKYIDSKIAYELLWSWLSIYTPIFYVTVLLLKTKRKRNTIYERQNKYLFFMCGLILLVTFYLIDMNNSSAIYKNVTCGGQLSPSLTTKITNNE